MAVWNTELCEIVDVEPKSVQSMPDVLERWHRLLHMWTPLARWYNRKQEVYLVRVGSLLYPELLHQERPTTRSQVREERLQRIPHGKNNFKGDRKKHYENIHDRFIRDKWFRKTMIELGRSNEVILEMDRLASEDHSLIATEEEIDVYRGSWWIRSNVVNFDTMPTRRQPYFKKALSTMHRLKKAEDKAHYENWSQSSSSWWQWQTTWWHPYYETSPQRWTEHWSNGETCVTSESSFFICGMHLTKNLMHNLQWLYR